MPRIRNFADLIFFRPDAHLICPHIDELLGERGRNVIDWTLVERHWRDLMQVAISISEGRLSSATLMRRLRSNSRKNGSSPHKPKTHNGGVGRAAAGSSQPRRRPHYVIPLSRPWTYGHAASVCSSE